MTTKPPTEPGDYHFKAEGSDEWEIVEVYEWNDPDDPLLVERRDSTRSVSEIEPGQWQRIPTPDEMQEAWAVYDVEDKEIIAASSINARDAVMKAWNALGDPRETNQCPGGYTCNPVAIYPRESEQ